MTRTTERYDTFAEEIDDLTSQLVEAETMLTNCDPDDDAQIAKIESVIHWIRMDRRRAYRG